jgi:hypothetical protein
MQAIHRDLACAVMTQEICPHPLVQPAMARPAQAREGVVRLLTDRVAVVEVSRTSSSDSVDPPRWRSSITPRQRHAVAAGV